MTDATTVTTSETQDNTESAAVTEAAPATEQADVQATETQVLQEQAAQTETPATPEAAPVDFTPFTLPEGMAIDEGAMSKFSKMAKADGLTQEQAQKYVTLQTELIQGHNDSMMATLDKTTDSWKQEVLANDLFKGDAGAANIKIASEAIAKLGGEKFVEYLETTGLGNHPEMVKLGFEISKLINEDTLVNSGSPGGNKSGSFESALYGNK